MPDLLRHCINANCRPWGAGFGFRLSWFPRIVTEVDVRKFQQVLEYCKMETENHGLFDGHLRIRILLATNASQYSLANSVTVPA